MFFHRLEIFFVCRHLKQIVKIANIRCRSNRCGFDFSIFIHKYRIKAGQLREPAHDHLHLLNLRNHPRIIQFTDQKRTVPRYLHLVCRFLNRFLDFFLFFFFPFPGDIPDVKFYFVRIFFLGHCTDTDVCNCLPQFPIISDHPVFMLVILHPVFDCPLDCLHDLLPVCRIDIILRQF